MVKRCEQRFLRKVGAAVVAITIAVCMGAEARAYSFTGKLEEVLSDCLQPDTFEVFTPHVFHEQGLVFQFESAIAWDETTPITSFQPYFENSVPPEYYLQNGEITISIGPNPQYSGYYVDVTREIFTKTGQYQDASLFPVGYPTYDLAVRAGTQSNEFRRFHARFFMTNNFIWIETRSGPSDLARTFVTPLFFGYGEQMSADLENNKAFTLWVPENYIQQCIPIKVSRFNYSELQQSIQSRYSRSHPYPFIEHGGGATALTTAITQTIAAFVY